MKFKYIKGGVECSEKEAFEIYSKYESPEWTHNVWANLNSEACRDAVKQQTRGFVEIQLIGEN
jgi:hypothetical protein